MSKPFFSVIISAFNSAGFIRKGLDSIRDQSFTDYELIIACDKCHDNTAEVAREYTDKVIEIDHDIDGGGHYNALKIATGDWVLFMDDDDWWLHEFAFEMLAAALKEIGTEKIDLLAFSFIMRGVGYARNSPQKIYPALWNKAWRREFIGNDPLPEYDMSVAKLFYPKARFVFWDTPLYYYNFMHEGSVSDKLKKGEIDLEEIPEDIRGELSGYKNALNDGSIRV
jgi:glycosyltransferase involved in cell wall biosynthesis